MQIQRPDGNILTISMFENRLVQIRLNEKTEYGYKPRRKAVIMLEPQLIPNLIEALIAFDREGRCQHDSNRQCKSQA